MVQKEESSKQVDSAVEQGGAYEIIRKRLQQQGSELTAKTQELNNSRLSEFGSAEMSVVSRVRVRTENNCIARDIVQVGKYLLFGYNVFIGLKAETKIEDVFSLFQLAEGEDGVPELEPVEIKGTFLDQTSFVNDFKELYGYYKNSRLVELTINNGKLLASFQIGERLEDVRVFRWGLSPDHTKVNYEDNRGERDIRLPPRFGFEWKEATRDLVVHGRHPHINILDTIFVETVGGDLTIKIENNTDDGLGLYRESVEDKTQSLDDAQVGFASLGDLIILKVLPYKENQWRYFVFNNLNKEVHRIDEIGLSCVELPEDHGIIFPGGFYLNTGELKQFNDDVQGLRFKRSIRSPNGEDVLFVFYDPESGSLELLSYNMINKQLQNPLQGQGYALAANGQLIIFAAEIEATRSHPMQIWQTQYFNEDFSLTQPSNQSFYGRIGNAELVRGISELFSVCRLIENQKVSAHLYHDLSQSAQKLFDNFHWLSKAELKAIADLLKLISETSELVLDEFEKVESIRQQAQSAMHEAENQQKDIFQSLHPDSWTSPEEFVAALHKIRAQRGHLMTIRDYRYINTERLDALDKALVKKQEELGQLTVEFLEKPGSLKVYDENIELLREEIKKSETVVALLPHIEKIENMASGLDLLSELMSTLKVTDATVRTNIIDTITEVYSRLNQSKASARHKKESLGSDESVAQFSAQFKLFSQSVANALGMSSTPEKCEAQLSRLLVQLEELESQFSDHEQFLTDILEKREEVYESFESHKQQLSDQRQRKAQTVSEAASRILKNIEKRSLKFNTADDLNTYFASDALVLKIYGLVEQLRELDSAVKADDLESRFKATKNQALRALRDKVDIYEEGGNVIKLGPRHKFSVNTQELDLTIIPREGRLNTHLSGTEYFEAIENEKLNALKDYWNISLESESNSVYRAEYLAYQILKGAWSNTGEITSQDIANALAKEQLVDLVRSYASPRYKEGYEKGIHDFDAAIIIEVVNTAVTSAGVLRYDPLCRAVAVIFLANTQHESLQKTWKDRAYSASQMNSVFNSRRALQLLCEEVTTSLSNFLVKFPIQIDSHNIVRAAEYLIEELSEERFVVQTSRYARDLAEDLKGSMNDETWKKYQLSLEKLKGKVFDRWSLTEAWLEALIEKNKLESLRRYVPEAIALINADERVDRHISESDLELSCEGLMGDHSLIKDRRISFSLDDFLTRLEHHSSVVVKKYHEYLNIRKTLIEQEKNKLRLGEFKPRPLSSFVRNKLINDAYLPIIGDNLAKQMGTVGENKRTDLMGLLMMISPPGYGKTTLMEYVASCLGLIFMKINCPSLGHDVLSLDPEQAPNATAKQEIIKLNLGLEMGSNVMLYLDDIQHTNPEFLQKFISLCDGTRRIEGVWQGETKTYDMRGKKFCVVMAGNPYTESGEVFKIPDMLANRADIYNLGDILGGMDEQFELSYIENSMTSNAVLAPLANREIADIYKFIDMAKGKPVASSELSHNYSGAEVKEIIDVLKKMFVIQNIVLKVNKQYIISAAQADSYRTEPPFKLQGSYRNMNKMAEKLSAVMNEEEMMSMIRDHYLGEAQLLTSGAEENLLKLAELRGNITEAEQVRWEKIKRDFVRNKAMGGEDSDGITKVANQIAGIGEAIVDLHKAVTKTTDSNALIKPISAISHQLAKVNQDIHGGTLKVEVANTSNKQIENITETLNDSTSRLLEVVERSIDFDISIVKKITKLSADLRSFSIKAGLRKKGEFDHLEDMDDLHDEEVHSTKSDSSKDITPSKQKAASKNNASKSKKS